MTPQDSPLQSAQAKSGQHEGAILQGDGSSNRGAGGLVLPTLYAVRGGQRYPIQNVQEFRKAGYSRSAVQVVPDAELERLPLAGAAKLAPGQQITLDLDSFLGAGHYMTTHGVLRKTDQGGHVDATTRTRTITAFGGFHGGVNMVYSDAQGFPVGMSATQRFGVDGTWIGRSDRTDYWSQDLSNDWATRTTSVALFHFWDPDQLDSVVHRWVDMLKPVADLVKEIIAMGGGAKSS
ncbi:MAG TPA: hypothetical protein VGC80_02880 [Acetobacteraceae bacterium]|jgi:hypothetical protein